MGTKWGSNRRLYLRNEVNKKQSNSPEIKIKERQNMETKVNNQPCEPVCVLYLWCEY